MFMEVNELRIGNFLYPRAEFHNGEQSVRQVFGLHQDNRVSYIANSKTKVGYQEQVDDNINQIDPIPISEDWLHKFGFIKHSKFDVYSQLDVHIGNKYYQLSVQNQISFTDDWSVLLDGYLPAIQIQYIHQLQNLYFTLTGEELRIKNG